MAYKSAKTWIKDGEGIPRTAINGNGVWELQDAGAGVIRSDINVTIMFSSVSANASGVTVAAGLRTVAGKTPVPVAGASKALAGLANGQDSLDVMFQPKGRICLTVTGYVAPLVAEVTQ